MFQHARYLNYFHGLAAGKKLISKKICCFASGHSVCQTDEFAMALDKQYFSNVRPKRIDTCLVVGIPIRYLQGLHCTYHAVHCHEYVLVNEFDEAPFVIVRVATTVDNSHLLNERTFTRLSSTYIQHQQLLIYMPFNSE